MNINKWAKRNKNYACVKIFEIIRAQNDWTEKKKKVALCTTVIAIPTYSEECKYKKLLFI